MTAVRVSAPMEVTIHQARSADASSITSLLAASDLRTEGVLDDNTCYWIARDGTDHPIPIGAIGLELGEHSALLRSAVVVAPQRGRGIGTLLTEHALDWAWRHGFRAVYCFSTDAGDYWMRRGFVQCDVGDVLLELPDAPQVRVFASLGWLRSGVSFVRFSNVSSACLPS